MHVGFVCHYHHNEQTILVNRLASLALEVGASASIFSPEKVLIKSPCKAISEDVLDFPSWCIANNLLVWLFPPTPSLVHKLQQFGIPSLYLFSWTEIVEIKKIKQSCKAVTGLVTPSRYSAKILADEWGLSSVTQMPWDTGAPLIHRKDYSTNSHIVIYVSYNYELAMAIIIADMLLSTNKLLKIDLIVGPGRIVPSERNDLYRGRKIYASRLRVFPRRLLSIHSLRSLLIASDFTIMTSIRDGVGEFCLEALAAGSPVVAHDIPVLSELLRDGYNAALVSCEFQKSKLGFPVAIPEPAALFDAARILLGNPHTLKKLSNNCSHGLAARGQTFRRYWGTIFSDPKE